MLLETLLGVRKLSASVGNASGGWGFFGWPLASSGEAVNPSTALGLSAYYACIRNISEDVAKLPIVVGKKVGDKREVQDGHPVSRLLNVAPCPEMVAMTWRETMQAWAMGWGSGWAEIERDRRGLPVNLWLIHPSRADLRRAEDNTLWLHVTSEKGQSVDLPYRDVLHVRGLGDGLTGYSVAAIGCESIGRALAVQKHSGSVFASGGLHRMALKHPGKMSDKARMNLRESWKGVYGGAGNSQTPVLDEGMDVSNIGVNAEESQLIETTEFTVEDLARWFRCPPNKIGHFLRAQGWSTLEMLNMDYVTDTLLPWAIRWEQECRRKLFGERELDLYIKHNFASLLRGDSAARQAFYTAMNKMGVLHINEIRGLEDMDGIGPDGDVRVVGNGMQTLDSLLNPPKPPPVVVAPPGGDEPTPDDQEEPADSGNELRNQVAAALILDGTLSEVAASLETKACSDRIRLAFAPIIAGTIGRALSQERNQVRRAASRWRDKGKADRFGEWAESFYDGHVLTIANELSEPLRGVGMLTGRFVDPDRIGLDYARRHCAESRAALPDFDFDVDKRAATAAEDLITRALEAN